LHNASDHARAVEIGSGWLLLFTVALGDEQDDLVFRERGFDGRERSRSPNEQRDYYIGENDNIPKRKDRNAVRRRDALVIPLKDWRQGW
jgi:hypothetical protein